jgi:hypothetical protein
VQQSCVYSPRRPKRKVTTHFSIRQTALTSLQLPFPPTKTPRRPATMHRSHRSHHLAVIAAGVLVSIQLTVCRYDHCEDGRSECPVRGILQKPRQTVRLMYQAALRYVRNRNPLHVPKYNHWERRPIRRRSGSTTLINMGKHKRNP